MPDLLRDSIVILVLLLVVVLVPLIPTIMEKIKKRTGEKENTQGDPS